MSSQPNASLLDGLHLLAHIAVAGRAVGCRPLARELDMDAVRCNRLLKSLAQAGYLEQDAQRRYRPGSSFQVLAAAALHGLPWLRQAAPLLHDLAQQCGHTVALGVRWQDRVVYLWHGGQVGASAPYPAAESSIGQLFSDPHSNQTSAQMVHGQHRSLAVPLPDCANMGLALTAIPLQADLTPLRHSLHDYAQRISELYHD